MTASIEDRLVNLGLTLPEAAAPLANYVLARVSGEHLYVSGHLGKRDGVIVTGKVGQDVERHDAYEAARAAAIDILASARGALGSLDRLRGVVKVTGFVNSGSDFTDHSAIVNGASDLFVEVLGPEHGRHARSAVGVAQLPRGAAVEVEAVFELSPPDPGRATIEP
jgi:enamine deaminase RidA (YjgF/YER057c/UK114 family)